MKPLGTAGMLYKVLRKGDGKFSPTVFFFLFKSERVNCESELKAAPYEHVSSVGHFFFFFQVPQRPSLRAFAKKKKNEGEFPLFLPLRGMDD